MCISLEGETHVTSCVKFKVYMAEQHVGLKKAIDEDKWYLSERAGFDVGFEAAERNFCKHHLDRFAQAFRVDFCHNRCPERHHCELAKTVEQMRSTEQLRRQVARS